MKKSQGFMQQQNNQQQQQHQKQEHGHVRRSFIITICHLAIIFCSCLYFSNSVILVNGKHVNHHGGNYHPHQQYQPHHHRVYARSVNGETSGGGGSGGDDHHHGDIKSCEVIKHYFDAQNVTIHPKFDSTGSICGGHCCENKTEQELMTKSTNSFDRLLRHHTRSLRGNLESMAKIFRDHVLELSYQSENKTLILFSQVYRRMAPLSREPISDLYKKIRNHINLHDNTDFDKIVKHFFTILFPVAYHRAVHSESAIPTSSPTSSSSASSSTHTPALNGDFHVDYKNCLKHIYDDLQPFGQIPNTLTKNLQQSLSAASTFITALERGADILASTEEIDSDYLTDKCRHHLMKMTYCSQCNGLSKHRTKSCYGYCTNVMRGCLAQYVGKLDSPWSNVAESIDSLWHNALRTERGIEEVIKTLDVKLSEAIMHAMENGPELEKKVKKACGIPTLLPSDKMANENNDNVWSTHISMTNHQKQWVSPPDADMLKCLVAIDKSKDFYSKIVDSVCEDEEFKRDDQNCWTGDRIGDYTQTILPTAQDSQRYNPEVPYETHAFAKESKLNELVDKLIKLRMSITTTMSMYSSQMQYSDIQSDMFREEGSGGAYRDDMDQEEELEGSAEGSGLGIGTTVAPSSKIEVTLDGNRSTGTQIRISYNTMTLLMMLMTMSFMSYVFCSN